MSERKSFLLGCAAALAAVSPARGQNYYCTVAAGDLAFGNYSVIYSATADTSASIDMSCVETAYSNVRVAITIALSAGSSGSYAQRTMQNGVSTLNYNIYGNSNRTRIWGDGSGGSRTYISRCNLRNANTSCTVSRSMYGRIPMGQNVEAGSYTDHIVITISY